MRDARSCGLGCEYNRNFYYDYQNAVHKNGTWCPVMMQWRKALTLAVTAVMVRVQAKEPQRPRKLRGVTSRHMKHPKALEASCRGR
jgi:hypothetical protein